MKISEVFRSMTSTWIDWRKFLANPRYCQDGNTVTWSNYNKGFFKGMSNAKDFYDLLDNKQYSFQVSKDGAIIQMYYAFNKAGRKLIAASLAFFGAPEEISEEVFMEESETGAIEHLPLSTDFVPWLRIDFDPSAASGVLHGNCHLHTAGLPNFRILVRGVPTPSQFVEFVMALFYPESYRIHRLAESGHDSYVKKMRSINRRTIPFPKSEIFKFLMHINVPG